MKISLLKNSVANINSKTSIYFIQNPSSLFVNQSGSTLSLRKQQAHLIALDTVTNTIHNSDSLFIHPNAFSLAAAGVKDADLSRRMLAGGLRVTQNIL